MGEPASQKTSAHHLTVQPSRQQVASSGAGPGKGEEVRKRGNKTMDTNSSVGAARGRERGEVEGNERTAITRDFATQGGSAARFAHPSICRECTCSAPGAPPANPPASTWSGPRPALGGPSARRGDTFSK